MRHKTHKEKKEDTNNVHAFCFCLHSKSTIKMLLGDLPFAQDILKGWCQRVRRDQGKLIEGAMQRSGVPV